MMACHTGKLVTVGSMHGPPTDVEISSRAQTLCPLLPDLPSGSALPDVHAAALHIVLAHLDGDENFTALTTSTFDTALLLLFAQTWALAARLGLPTAQNKLMSTMRDVYNTSLDDRTVYQADKTLLQAFNHLAQEVGQDSHAESFLICFVARTTPTTSALEKQLDAHDFANDIRMSLLAEARSFDRDYIKHTPQKFYIDISHVPLYRPLEAHSSFVPVSMSRHAPVPAIDHKHSCTDFLGAGDPNESFQDPPMLLVMSPPPTYDNLFDYSAVPTLVREEKRDSALEWTLAVGRNSLLPAVPTMTNPIVMPADVEYVAPSPAQIRRHDPAATAAQNARLGLGNGIPASASNTAPAVPAAARDAVSASNAPPTPPPSPPPTPASSPTRRPVDTVPARQRASSVAGSDTGSRQPRSSVDAPQPGANTRAPQTILHCCEVRPAKPPKWISRFINGWRSAAQHGPGTNPPANSQPARSARATNCRDRHCKLPAAGSTVHTHTSRDNEHDNREARAARRHTSPSRESRRGGGREPWSRRANAITVDAITSAELGVIHLPAAATTPSHAGAPRKPERR